LHLTSLAILFTCFGPFSGSNHAFLFSAYNNQFFTYAPQLVFAGDTTKPDTLYYPFQDYYDFTSRPENSPLFMEDPSNIQQNFELTEDGTGFYVTETMGGIEIRPPSYMTFEEYENYFADKSESDFFKEKSIASNEITSKGLIPAINVNSGLFRDIFGGGTVEIRPNGTALLTFGVRRNKNANPSLTIQQQRNISFDFDQQIQLNVVGKIGEKLKIKVNQNTEATFNFENQMKLEYTGFEDEILQKVEAGNVSLPLNGSLISGGQNLFGIKLGMRFGPLDIVTIASQQKGKTSEVSVKGGAQTTSFQKKADEYDEWKHYFLSHYFRDNYESWLQNLPALQSPVNIQRIEVWVTNTSNATTQNLRNGVGLVDLGESNDAVKYNQAVAQNNNNFAYPVTDNNANLVYDLVTNQYPGARNFNDVIYTDPSQTKPLTGMEQTRDFERQANLRRLNDNEYRYNKNLGYISLNTKVQANEVVFVSYEYTHASYPGQVFKVGEFSLDVPSSQDTQNVLFLKMLKRTNVSPVDTAGNTYPAWNLMMKNVYSIGGFNLQPDNFRVDIYYQSTGGAGDITYLPTSAVANTPLLQVMNLDKLRNNSESGPDNYFDFLDGRTIISEKGIVIFPVLEPFGSHLVSKFNGNQQDSAEYAFTTLYSKTRADAVAFSPQVNRYYLKGQYQSSSSSEIMLNSVQIAQGSVRVTAGGAPLTEGADYTVDYSVGKVNIINPGILTSGQEIKVTFETNTLFDIQAKTLVGARFDLNLSKDVRFGATILHLNERPLTQKILIGDEPLSNTMWGLDGQLNKQSKFLTRLLDRLPLLNTKEISQVNVSGEFAQLLPGHPKQIETSTEKGIAYLDDFESTKTFQDLMGAQGWKISSFPTGSGLFIPQDTSPISSGFTRAKMTWYQIDQALYNSGILSDTTKNRVKNDPYQRQYNPKDVFPNLTTTAGSNLLNTLDIQYFPTQRGPYNYEYRQQWLNTDGTFVNPEQNWAGMMRRTTGNTDFEAANFEFIEFWMLDPFLNDSSPTNGFMAINLGKISEDVIPDGNRFIENGMPEDGSVDGLIETAWGFAPAIIPPNTAFSNNANARQFQDVGFDGLSDGKERDKFQFYLSNLGFLNPDAYNALNSDPSSDNFRFWDESSGGFNADVDILTRYRNYYGTERNSPVASGGQQYTPSSTQMPDNEDLNNSNTLNQFEEYYEYKVKINPGDLQIGRNNIVDKVEYIYTTTDGTPRQTRWYQFRIPLVNGLPVNGISNFKAIDFIRMYVSGFDRDVVMRFAKFQLVATQWRAFRNYLGDDMVGPVIDPGNTSTIFDVGTVNIEENGAKSPVNYVIPPGIIRQNNPGDPTTNTLQNEQALLLRVCNLEDGDARGVFKTIQYDLRSYTNLKLWVHAEQVLGDLTYTQRGDLTCFIRVGSDYTDNYYEYEVPLTPSTPGVYNGNSEADRAKVWLPENQIDFPLSVFSAVKTARNDLVTGGVIGLNDRYSKSVEGTDGHRVTVIGNPQMNSVKNIMIGLRNPKDGNGNVCAEVWVNELRVTDFNEKPGWAANGRLNLKLADFAQVQLSGSHTTPGFSSIETKINDRSRVTISIYNFTGNFELGKLFPNKFGIQMPLYLTYGESFKNPQFNPLDPDILFDKAFENKPGNQQDSLKKIYQEYQLTRSYGLNNVRKMRTNSASKPHFFQVENFAFTWSVNEQFFRSHTIENQTNRQHKAVIDYAYNFTPKLWKPFKDSKMFGFLKEFNFYNAPKSIAFKIDGDRKYEERRFRSTANQGTIQPNFTNNFLINRTYAFRYDISQNLSFNYSAQNQARVDEPFGAIDTKEKRDSLFSNLLTLGKDTSKNKTQLINMGRNLSFNQNIQINYKLPFDKIKPLNWINSTANYTGTFKWQSAQLQNVSLGNTINNGATIQTNNQLNLGTLYKKVPFLKKIIEEKPKAPKENQVKAGSGPQNKPVVSQDTTKDDPFYFIKLIGKEVARIILSVQTIEIQQGNNRTTSLPGYMPYTDNFGLDFNYQAPDSFGVKNTALPPGIGFILGDQKDIRNQAAQNGWISKDTSLAYYYQTSNSNQLTGRTNVTLFKGFKIDLTVSRNKSEQYNSIFGYNSQENTFQNANENMTGSYSVSYIGASTLFEKSGTTSKAFDDFANTRRIISKRLSKENPNYNAQNPYFENSEGYFNGYDKASQDVLIPAFLAAYGSGKAEKIGLTPMPAIPLPNWNVNYSGLGNIPALKDIFNSVTITHAYRGTYSVGSYVRNLSARDSDNDGYSAEVTEVGPTTDIDGNSATMVNFQPINVITNVSLTESFAPFLGVQMNFKKGYTFSFEHKRDRTLSLNIGNTQISEVRSKDFTFNFGWKKDKLNLTLRLFGRTINMTNTLNCRLETTLRDTRTRNRTLDLKNDPAPVTNGNFSLIVKPSVDYQVSTRFTLRLFAEHNLNKPAISSSFPTSFTNIGLQARFTLTN